MDSGRCVLWHSRGLLGPEGKAYIQPESALEQFRFLTTAQFSQPFHPPMISGSSCSNQSGHLLYCVLEGREPELSGGEVAKKFPTGKNTQNEKQVVFRFSLRLMPERGWPLELLITAPHTATPRAMGAVNTHPEVCGECTEVCREHAHSTATNAPSGVCEEKGKPLWRAFPLFFSFFSPRKIIFFSGLAFFIWYLPTFITLIKPRLPSQHNKLTISYPLPKTMTFLKMRYSTLSCLWRRIYLMPKLANTPSLQIFLSLGIWVLWMKLLKKHYSLAKWENRTKFTIACCIQPLWKCLLEYRKKRKKKV